MTPLARRVRGQVYRTLAHTGCAPRVEALAQALGVASVIVRHTLGELAAAHALLLDASGDVEWALPFAAVPTPYRVTGGMQAWHTPCAWDALALGPLLGRETVVHAACPDCGEALRVAVTPESATVLDRPAPAAVVHFGRPAPEWWVDIRET